MTGKMVKMPKQVHSSKPEEVMLPNGEVIKTMTCKDDSKGELVWVRVIEL